MTENEKIENIMRDITDHTLINPFVFTIERESELKVTDHTAVQYVLYRVTSTCIKAAHSL